MAPEHDADLIILGGGLAGLSLAARLARLGARYTVRIIEPRETYTENRSWCFWAPARNPLSHFVTERWSQWAIGRAGEPDIVHAVPGLSYQHVASGPVFDRLLADIEAAPQIRLEAGLRAWEVVPVRGGMAVETARGRLVARHVVDTRPPTDAPAGGTVLFQCFAGALVRAGTLPGRAELMSGMRADPGGLSFDYVLPLGNGLARAEAVRWSSGPVARDSLQRGLDALLERRGFTAEGPVSFGVLPTGMRTDRPAPLGGLTRAAIGTGGWRAGTGHALLRIDAWASRCAARLMAGAPPVSHREASRLSHVSARLVLTALARHPERMDANIARLARHLPPASLTRVMSASARFPDTARTMSTLTLGRRGG